MLILTTFSPQCATLGWFKADAHVKKEHFQEIKLKIFLGPLYQMRIYFLYITLFLS